MYVRSKIYLSFTNLRNFSWFVELRHTSLVRLSYQELIANMFPLKHALRNHFQSNAHHEISLVFGDKSLRNIERYNVFCCHPKVMKVVVSTHAIAFRRIISFDQRAL